jgi:tRNA (guanine-N7-)-methyltransferase
MSAMTTPTGRLLYGRRRGRALRPGQAERKERLLPQLTVALPSGGRLDPASLFPAKPLQVWLEIGFGGGEHMAALAECRPDIGFVGCEVFENGIARLLGEIENRGLANIRLFVDDARLLLTALAPNLLGRVFILFPDPWPKARHHKRRIVSGETLDALAAAMTDGAELRLATDDPLYLRAMLDCVCAHPDFLWLARRPGDWRQRPADWPPTRYEEKALAAGRRPVFLRFVRRARR